MRKEGLKSVIKDALSIGETQATGHGQKIWVAVVKIVRDIHSLKLIPKQNEWHRVAGGIPDQDWSGNRNPFKTETWSWCQKGPKPRCLRPSKNTKLRQQTKRVTKRKSPHTNNGSFQCMVRKEINNVHQHGIGSREQIGRTATWLGCGNFSSQSLVTWGLNRQGNKLMRFRLDWLPSNESARTYMLMRTNLSRYD